MVSVRGAIGENPQTFASHGYPSVGKGLRCDDPFGPTSEWMERESEWEGRDWVGSPGEYTS